jgi:hypothetical protein
MCLTHVLQHVAEIIKLNHTYFKQFIATIKKIFFKALSRVSKFNELYPDLNFPLKNILIIWSKWLKAAQYDCVNFEKIKVII